MDTAIKRFVEDNTQLAFDLLRDLCLIPAPSHHEEARGISREKLCADGN